MHTGTGAVSGALILGEIAQHKERVRLLLTSAFVNSASPRLFALLRDFWQKATILVALYASFSLRDIREI